MLCLDTDLGMLGGGAGPLNFSATTYTGNGGAGQTITTGIDNDLVWIKGRTGTKIHALFNSQTTVGNYLKSHNTDEEFNIAGITAFTSTGFTLGGNSNTNDSGFSYRSFAWREAAGFFDIVLYSGNGSNRTIAHGLGVAPKLMLVKNRTIAGAWRVYHASNTAAPETDYLELDTDNSTVDDNTIWNDTAPTSSVFSVGTAAAVNASGSDYVAYLFAEDAGNSKFGTYSGTGSSQSVSIGFQPSLLMVKNSGASGNWVMVSNTNSQVLADVTDDASTSAITLTSSGFDITGSTANVNASSNTYVYAAWR